MVNYHMVSPGRSGGACQGQVPLASNAGSPPTRSPQAPPSLERLSAGSRGAELATAGKPCSCSSSLRGWGVSLRGSAVSQVRARQRGGTWILGVGAGSNRALV